MIDITEECMTAEEIRAINPDFDDPEMFIGKGNEIKHWLLEHTAEGYRYVILDDEPDILSEQRPNLSGSIPSAASRKRMRGERLRF